MSRKPLLDPVDEAQRREDLKRLVADVGRLPAQQRSALLMREIDGLSYADLAGALDVTVPAVKSLLVRARVGLVEAQESRDADCGEIQRDLLASYDRGVKASGRARRHMRECHACREYRSDLRGVRRRFAALSPVGAGPLALVAKLLGGGGAAAAGGTGGAALAGGAGAATACKVAAAVVCATAITAGGAVEVNKLTQQPAPTRERKAETTRATPRAAAAAHNSPARAAVAAAPVYPAAAHAVAPARTVAAPQAAGGSDSRAPADSEPLVAPPPEPAPYTGNAEPPVSVGAGPQVSSGGTAAPDDAPAADRAPVPDGAVGEAPDEAAVPVATQDPAAVTPAPSPAPSPAAPAAPAQSPASASPVAP
jgi:hypothetical protein